MTTRWNSDRLAGLQLLCDGIEGYASFDRADEWASFMDVVTYHLADQLAGAALLKRFGDGRGVSLHFAMNAAGAGHGGMFFRALMRDLHARNVQQVSIDVPAGGAVSGYLSRLGPWRFLPNHRRAMDHFDFLTARFATNKTEVLP